MPLKRPPELDKKEWLIENFVVKNRLKQDIAKGLNCQTQAVTHALMRHGLEKRTKLKSKNIYLNDKQWLHQQRTIQKKTLKEIAVLANCGEGGVYNALLHHEIPTTDCFQSFLDRRKDDGFSLASQEQIDTFEGSLLGDGYLELGTTEKSSRFKKKNKHLPHILYVTKILFGKNNSIKIRSESDDAGTRYSIYSNHKRELSIIYDDWYGIKRKIKEVPKNLKLTPGKMLHWFLDDGSTTLDKSGYIQLTFNTQSFNTESLQTLQNELTNFGIDSIQTKEGIGKISKQIQYKIKVRPCHVNRFFEIIGPCPEEIKDCMGYKWKIHNRTIKEGHRTRFKTFPDKAWFLERKNKTTTAISKEISCSADTIRRAFKRYGIKRPDNIKARAQLEN